MRSIIAAFKRWGRSLVIPTFLHPRHERDFGAFIRLCLGYALLLIFSFESTGRVSD